MAGRTIIVILFISLFALHSIECSAIDSDFTVAVVENLATFLSENPEVKVLHELEKQVLNRDATRDVITYSDGSRTSDDRLVADTKSANVGASLGLASAQDIKYTISYPPSGEGYTVTFVRVVVEQSNDKGKAYITSGGVGQKKYTFVIEAEKTTIFKYNAEFYGK